MVLPPSARTRNREQCCAHGLLVAWCLLMAVKAARREVKAPSGVPSADQAVIVLLVSEIVPMSV